MEQTPTLQLTFEVSTPDRPPYRVALTKPKNLIGRESGDVVLGDTEASALHAEIDTTAGHVIVRDLGSSNGTWRDGKRLPQFALFEGQAFHCGNTELRLISIEGGSDNLKPGQTAVGRTKVTSNKPGHETLLGSPSAGPVAPPPGWSPPSPVSLGEPAPVAETTHVAPRLKPPSSTLPGPHAPSSSPTVPGEEPSSVTLTGGHAQVVSQTAGTPAPALRQTTPSSATVPGPAGKTSATPSSPTLPVHTTDIPPAAPAHAAGVESTPSASVRSSEPATAPEPPATREKKPRFNAPVANAVIKAGGASEDAGRASAPRSATPPRRWGRLLSIAGLSALGVTAIAGLGYLIYTLVAGRALGFSEEVAADLPSSTIGFLALQSVEETVTLLANEDLDGQWKDLRTDALGFDPYDEAQWAEQGIDTQAPVGIALLDAKAPTFAVSFGVTDREALKSAVAERAALLLATDADEASWSERTFGGADGLWHEERGIAVVYREKRASIVFTPRPGRGDEVEVHATAIGSLQPKNSLAETEAYAELQAPPGDIVGLAYVDGSALRNALPAGAAALAARLALADLDGIAVLLSHEANVIHVTYEVVVREGSRHLEVLDDAKRDGEALARLQGPVLAAYDVQLNGESLDRAVGGVISALGESVSAVEKEFSDQLGIDLRTDVTQNLSGAFGGALLGMPSERGEGHELEAVSWVGVRDGEKAQKTLARLYDKAVAVAKEGGGDLTPREVAGVQVYTVAGNQEYGRPDLQSFVHENMLWILVGAVDATSIIEGPKSPFLDEPRHPSIAEALRKGGNIGGFADLAQLATAIRPLLRTRDRDDFDTLEPLMDAFETATIRSERHGRTIVVRSTAHTADTVGLPGVLKTATKLAGEAMGEEFARATRASRCTALSKHVLQLSRNSLEESGAPLDTAWEIERSVQEQCDKPSMTTARLDCYLKSESIKGLAACDARHPAREGAVGKDPTEVPLGPTEATQPEPKLVPYVDDIWPHRVDDPDSDSPQPDVNYAVPVGNDPHTRGRDDALVTIVMFGDFECEHCRSVTGTLDGLLAKHGEDVRLVFRHLPLENIHSSARSAARASLAAGRQDKFWEMHDALFQRGNRLGADTIEAAAKEAGLEMARYKTALASADIDRQLQRDIDAAGKFGVRGTPAFFINGRYLGGRQGASAFDTLITEELERAKKFTERRGNTRKRLYEDMLVHFAPEVVQPETAIAAPAGDSKRYVVSTDGLPRKGAATFAQIEVIECGDFDCPFCARSRKAIEETLESYPAVAFFFAHNPLDYHPGAEPAARAAQAAHAQGKFWEMHDELYKDQRSKARSDEDYTRYAARLGLDVEQFEQDYASAKTAETVAAQQKLCTEHDATATPTFFINGRRVTGAQTAEQLSALVESELSKGI